MREEEKKKKRLSVVLRCWSLMVARVALLSDL